MIKVIMEAKIDLHGEGAEALRSDIHGQLIRGFFLAALYACEEGRKNEIKRQTKILTALLNGLKVVVVEIEE